jgi:hypothetical protein
MRARARRRTALAFVACAVLAGWAPGAGRVRAQEADDDPARRAVMISLPRLTWADVAAHALPNLDRLLRQSSVASLSLRTLGATTNLGEGYVTIGAGNRATANEVLAGLAFGADETIEGGRAADVWARRTGEEPDAEVLHLAVKPIQETNDDLLYGAEPGALGRGLHDSGRTTAVVANSDVDGVRHREAALAVMDDLGRIDGGEVDATLNEVDLVRPFGTRTDLDAATEAVRDALAAHDVVLVEASDLERADLWAELESEPASLGAALEDADALVGAVLEEVDLSRDLVLVVTPAPPGARGELGVFAMAGWDGAPVEAGLARSGTTRRSGYVTLPDIAPTILDAFGIDLPDEVTGTAIVDGERRTVDAGLYRDLADENEQTGFRDDATGPVSVVFVLLQVLTYGLAVLALTGDRTGWRPAVKFLALVCLAIPVIGFWSGLVQYEELGLAPYLLVLLAAAVAVAGIARLLGAWAGARRWRSSPLLPPLVIIGLTWLTLVIDVVTGGALQINTVFGYSPVVAGRFAGYGNLAFALLAMSAMVVATGIWGLPRLRRDLEPGEETISPTMARWTLVGATAVLLVTVFVDGYPTFGSDVGGVLATVPGFAVVILLLAGSRLHWRRVAVVAMATAIAVSVFAAVDLARPEDERTHLGRLVADLTGDGGGGFATIIQRKLTTNLNILFSSIWTLIIPAAFAFLAFLIWRPRGFLRDLQERVPGLRACLAGAIVVGILGFTLNDSGVAVPAMMLAVLLPYLTYLVLRTAPP